MEENLNAKNQYIIIRITKSVYKKKKINFKRSVYNKIGIKRISYQLGNW